MTNVGEVMDNLRTAAEGHKHKDLERGELLREEIDQFLRDEVPRALAVLAPGIQAPRRNFADALRDTMQHVTKERQKIVSEVQGQLRARHQQLDAMAARCDESDESLLDIASQLQAQIDRADALRDRNRLQRVRDGSLLLHQNLRSAKARALPKSARSEQICDAVLSRLAPLRMALPPVPNDRDRLPLHDLTDAQLTEIIDANGPLLDCFARAALLAFLRKMRCESDWDTCAAMVDSIARWPSRREED